MLSYHLLVTWNIYFKLDQFLKQAAKYLLKNKLYLYSTYKHKQYTHESKMKKS